MKGTRLGSILLVGAIGACALLGGAQFQEPHVELAGVAVTGLGMSGGSLKVELDVYNPNGYDIRGDRLTAELYLEDTHFGELSHGSVFELRAEKHTLLEIPMQFTWEGVGAAARGLLARGSVSYRLEGRLMIDAPGGDKRVTVGNSGVVAVRDVMGLD